MNYYLKINNKIHFNYYMNKNIKKLLESLFDDDFNDIYVDDTNSDTQEVSQMIQDNFKITSLAQCDNIDEVNEYFINKYDLVNNVLNTITDIMSAIKKTHFPYAIDCDQFNNEQIKITVETNYSSDIFRKYFKCVIGDNFIFNIKQIPYEITYRNKPKKFSAWCVSFPYTTDEIILSVCNIPDNMNTAVNKFITKYNSTQFDIKSQQSEIYDALLKQVEKVFNTQRITDELTCTGKVYKVVQKDIDRMNKCIDTRNFSGFDKITKADKMVARLAALFICAKNRNIKDLQLQFNDDILLTIILGRKIYNKSYTSQRGRYGVYRINMSSKEDFINILRKLQKFPTIHLKDVIATYNAYKDQF